MISLRYFARLREALGRAEEAIELPAQVKTIEDLMGVLRRRGGAWQEELVAGRSLRVAVNQAIAHHHTRISDGDEIAFFPPVTGG